MPKLHKSYGAMELLEDLLSSEVPPQTRSLLDLVRGLGHGVDVALASRDALGYGTR
jgi:hypothetical protein